MLITTIKIIAAKVTNVVTQINDVYQK